MRSLLATPLGRIANGAAALVAGLVLLGAGPAAPSATTAPVDLGTAGRYAILAGAGVTDSGPSTISGDVGTHPVAAIADLIDREASGKVDRAGTSSRQAQLDLADAFASIAALPRGGTVSLADDPTLAPGVYDVTDATQGIAGTLTLDGKGLANPVWIFVVARDLVTAAASSIELVNGAQACNVLWQVQGSVMVGAGSSFAGSILASASVTVGSGATIEGRLLARTGSVGLAGASVAVPVCEAVVTTVVAQPPAGALDPAPGAPVASTRTAQGSAWPALMPIVMVVLLTTALIMGEPWRGRRPDRRGVW